MGPPRLYNLMLWGSTKLPQYVAFWVESKTICCGWAGHGKRQNQNRVFKKNFSKIEFSKRILKKNFEKESSFKKEFGGFTCMIYKVYKLTSPENKSYIGCTSLELNSRFRNGAGYKNNDALYADIQKYGWNSFTKEILLQTSDKTQAFYAEEYLIFYYGDYNTASGNNNAHKRVPIAQYDHTGTMVAQYPSCTQAVWESGVGTASGIYSACVRKGTCAGFRWRFVSDGITKLPEYNKPRHGEKQVVQLTMDNQFIFEYNSVIEASKTTGINQGTIISVCKGRPKRVTAGGFKWMYKEDYEIMKKFS